MAEQQLYINGGYTSATSGRTFETINPANGEVLATVQAAGREDVDRAVKAQNAAKNLGGDDRHGTLAHSASRRRHSARAQRRAGKAGDPRYR
jgi:acyl-CoA reductase-like NAD-dependent aldehyde dehydrogenase